MHDSNGDLKKLEVRMAQTPPSSSKTVPENDVDEFLVVISGFMEKTVEETESLMEQMMIAVAGYQRVEIDTLATTTVLAVAEFKPPMPALKCIRAQNNATV